MRIISTFLLLIVSLSLAGCITGTYSMQELHENQARIEEKVDRLSRDIKASEDRDVEIEERVSGIEQVLNQNKALLAIYEKHNIAGPENGALWGSIENGDRTKEQENKRSARQEFAEIDSIDSADGLYSAAAKFYDRGNYEYAILTYQEFINKHPGDPRVPRANLKQGYALINIGRRQEAKYFLETIIIRYPRSSEAQIASNTLTELSE